MPNLVAISNMTMELRKGRNTPPGIESLKTPRPDRVEN